MMMRTEEGDVIEFYPTMIQDWEATKEKGYPVFKKKHYIHFILPGDRLTDPHFPVREDHIAKYPVQWKAYLEKGDTSHMSGLPIEQWNMISREQAEELKFLKVYTVEDLANISETNATQSGMNLVKYRQMAIDYLVASKKQADVALNAELMRQNKELEARLERLERAGVNVQEPETPNRRRGRPPSRDAISDAA